MANRAIFLDRDDTLIEDPGYINSPDQVKLLAGVPQALIELKAMGYKLVVVSNQSAVARGIITEKVLARIHDRLKQLLAEKGASLDRIYYCPHHPDGVIEKYRKESDSRKPNPGMLLTAAEQMDIDLRHSWLIGDSERDVEAGLRAGCRTVMVSHLSRQRDSRGLKVKPDYRAVNIKEAVNIIKKHHRSTSHIFHQIQDNSKPKPRMKAPVAPVQTKAEVITVEPPQQLPVETETNLPPQGVEQMLAGILEQLKVMQRTEMFGDFSMMRLLAGVVQIIALFCLLVTIWLLISPERQENSILIAIGFTGLLQLLSLTFYMMQGRK